MKIEKIFQSRSVLLFLIIPFFKPVCIQYFSVLQALEQLFVNWKMISAACILSLFLIHLLKSTKIPKLILYIVLYEAGIVFSTIYNQGYLLKALIDAVSITSFSILLILAIRYNSTIFLNQLGNLLKILMLSNLISMCIFPSGLPADLYYNAENALYFMVVDNGSALFLMFSMLIFILNDLVKKGRISRIGKILVFFCLWSGVMSHSATAVLILLAFIFFLILIRKRNTCNPWFFLLLFSICSVIMFAMQNSKILEFILVNILDRYSTFTSRYLLWNSAVQMIFQKPWLGYGRIDHDYIAAWGGYFSSHNFILEMLLQGGILAWSQFILIIIATVKRLYKGRGRKVIKALTIALFVVLTSALVESTIHSVYIWGIIVLCFE
ncbi:MAG: O-antigen ligase family protein, partial [Lachnospiraceae bacterium]|nr:O-antigen ligase family protein [Lachnospiraceae bacterium]